MRHDTNKRSTMKGENARTAIDESIQKYDESVERRNNDVNDKAVKRLLKQDQLSALQVGRILYLNVCEMTFGRKQLYSHDEYIKMQYKLERTKKEIGDFITYQRLVNYAVNFLNDIQTYEALALKGFKYIDVQMELIKNNPGSKLIDPDEIMSSIRDIRNTLQYINSYALFFDAMKDLLKNDRRLKESYRVPPAAQEIIDKAKEFDTYIEKSFTAEVRKKYELNFIGEIPRVYTEHKARAATVISLKGYLWDRFFYTQPIDDLATEATSIYINSHYPRD